jgi:hypothetical protein
MSSYKDNKYRKKIELRTLITLVAQQPWAHIPPTLQRSHIAITQPLPLEGIYLRYQHL